jgi:hypothetical protein
MVLKHFLQNLNSAISAIQQFVAKAGCSRNCACSKDNRKTTKNKSETLEEKTSSLF